MASIIGAAHVQSVPGELIYLAPECTTAITYIAPAKGAKTVVCRSYQMPVHNGRPVQDQFTIDRNGFAIIEHRSAVRDFTNQDEVDRIYAAEVTDFVKSYTGADRVAALGPVLRRAVAAGEIASRYREAVRPQSPRVHDDFSVDDARERAAAVYAKHFPEGPGYRRALITSLWRTFSPPPQDWPLTLCDYASVEPGEALESRLYYVDKVPDDLYAEMPPDTPTTSGVDFYHNPAHQWWYFPDMTREEILLFKLDDSDQSVAWRTPHTAFRDETVQAAEPRRSIEFRSIAYFE
jgi:hypothetical protein